MSEAAKTLSVWRGLPAMLRVSLADAVAYRSEFAVWFLSTNMPLVMLLLWRTVAEDGPVGRFGQKEFTAYFLLTLVVRLMTGAWVVWQMTFEIKQGSMGMRLLKPMHPFVSYAAENLGAMPLRLMLLLPVFVVIAVAVEPNNLSHDPVQWLLVVPSILGAWAISFCVMLSIGTLALFWESATGVFELWLGLYFVFSGYLIPLELFPDNMRAVLNVLPFRFMISFPVENALGLIDRRQSFALLLSQWSYVAGALGLALVLWRRGVKRFQAYGG